MDARYEKLAQLLKNEASANEIIADSAEETQKILHNKGLDFSVDELKELAKTLLSNDDTGEMDEKALERVSGGVNWRWVLTVINSTQHYPILRPRIGRW